MNNWKTDAPTGESRRILAWIDYPPSEYGHFWRSSPCPEIVFWMDGDFTLNGQDFPNEWVEKWMELPEYD